jgi:hypothetical protein
MNVKTLLALGGAGLALVLLPATGALAAGGTTVTVRVEGVKQTLLAPDTVHTRTGSITRFGAPRGACPATSAQGALDLATHHRWAGEWSTQFGPEYEITSIFGEAHSFTSKYFWEIFVDNLAASAGACQLKLHRGEQLLFAAVPQTGTVFPLGLTVLDRPVAGHPFRVRVVYYDSAGRPKPLAGATVTAGQISAEPIPHSRVSAKTNSAGIATLSESRLGLIELQASKPGYIRTAPQPRDVT